MLNRIVQMQFLPEHLPVFLAMFQEKYPQIRQFEGCCYLALWQSVDNPTIVFTYSQWESPEHLEKYRCSELFRETWQRTKTWFAAPPIAQSSSLLVEAR